PGESFSPRRVRAVCMLVLIDSPKPPIPPVMSATRIAVLPIAAVLIADRLALIARPKGLRPCLRRCTTLQAHAWRSASAFHAEGSLEYVRRTRRSGDRWRWHRR